MTGRPTDDDLRELLESRAGRLSPDADREAMAGFRAAMRGTRDARGGFSVLPVTIGGRGARLPGGIVALGLVAVILVAVLGGRLATPQEAASAGAPATGAQAPASGPTLAAAGPVSPGAPDDGLPQVWTGADLGEALAAGSAVGQVVVVSGPLTMHNCNPGGMCNVDIDGLIGLKVLFPRPPASTATISGSGSQTAFRVRADGSLDYLGEPDANPQLPLTVDGLVREDATPGRGLFVSGWLVPRSTFIGTQPCPAPSCEPGTPLWMLTGADPSVRGGLDISESMWITVDDGVQPDVDGLPDPSTFLVSSSGGGWQVDGVVAATISDTGQASPTPGPSDSPLVITLPVTGGSIAEDELQSRLADGSLEGRLVVIDGASVINLFDPCPGQDACFALLVPGGDMISFDADATTSALLSAQPPEDDPMVFTVHDGSLWYLGAGRLDFLDPARASDLHHLEGYPSTFVPGLERTLFVVNGWLVRGGITMCALIRPGGTPCPSIAPWLTDDRPAKDGTLASAEGIAVSLTQTPVPIDLQAVVTDGPFLVRYRPGWTICDAPAGVDCRPPSWEIVALVGPTSPLHSPLP